MVYSALTFWTICSIYRLGCHVHVIHKWNIYPGGVSHFKIIVRNWSITCILYSIRIEMNRSFTTTALPTAYKPRKIMDTKGLIDYMKTCTAQTDLWSDCSKYEFVVKYARFFRCILFRNERLCTRLRSLSVYFGTLQLTA